MIDAVLNGEPRTAGLVYGWPMYATEHTVQHLFSILRPQVGVSAKV
jgi:hypothetical protein